MLLREERVESGCTTEAGSAGATSVTSGSACVTGIACVTRISGVTSIACVTRITCVTRIACVTRIPGVTSITGTAGSTSSAAKPGCTEIEVSRFGVVVDACDISTQVAGSNGCDSGVVLHFVACVNRVASEFVFTVRTEDIAELQATAFDSSRDSAQCLNIFVTDSAAFGEVAVAGLLEDLFQVAVVVVTTGVFEGCRYQRESRRFASSRIVAVEVAVDDVGHIAHLLRALDTLTSVELGAVAFDDSSTLCSYRGLRLSGRNLFGIDVTVLIYRVDVGLETRVVGESGGETLRSYAAAVSAAANLAATAAVATATADLTAAAVAATAAADRCAAAVTATAATNRCAAAVAAATAAANLGYLLSAAGESAPALGHLLHRLHERLQHKHHLCLLRVKTETLLGSAECGCSERCRKLVDERILSGVKTALDKCHGLLPLVTFLCL